MKLPKGKNLSRLKHPRKINGVTYTHYCRVFNGWELWGNESPGNVFRLSAPE